MIINEFIVYLIIGYFVLIPAVLFPLSWITSFSEKGDRSKEKIDIEEEDEEYHKAA